MRKNVWESGIGRKVWGAINKKYEMCEKCCAAGKESIQMCHILLKKALHKNVTITEYLQRIYQSDDNSSRSIRKESR